MSDKRKSEELLENLDEEKLDTYKMRIYQLNQFNLDDMGTVIGQGIMSELLLDILQELMAIRKLLNEK
jgi:hypothetical protein